MAKSRSQSSTPKIPGATEAPAPQSAHPQEPVAPQASAEGDAPIDPEAADLIARLPDLENEQLIELDQAEREGEGREAVLEAIDVELKKRIALAAPPEPVEPAPTRQAPQVPAPPTVAAAARPALRAADVDARRITQPVLTEDGYVCPAVQVVPPNVQLGRLDVLDPSQFDL